MGPLTVFEILKDTRKIFPVCYDFKPLFNKMDIPKVGTENIGESSNSKAIETPIVPPKDPFVLDYVKCNFKPFRSCPTSDIAYNLIKLSKPGFTYSHPLLFASLY